MLHIIGYVQNIPIEKLPNLTVNWLQIILKCFVVKKKCFIHKITVLKTVIKTNCNFSILMFSFIPLS